MIDHDKDGVIGKEDLTWIFDQVGKMVEEKDVEAMLEEVPVPINFTQFLHLFAGRMSQGISMFIIYKLKYYNIYIK